MEEVKKHFKMYKAGKHWLVAGIVTVAAVAMGATAVHADTTAQIGSSTATPAVTGDNSHIGSIQNANGKGQAVKNAQPQAQPVVQPTGDSANVQQPQVQQTTWQDNQRGVNITGPITLKHDMDIPGQQYGNIAVSANGQQVTVTSRWQQGPYRLKRGYDTVNIYDHAGNLIGTTKIVNQWGRQVLPKQSAPTNITKARTFNVQPGDRIVINQMNRGTLSVPDERDVQWDPATRNMTGDTFEIEADGTLRELNANDNTVIIKDQQGNVLGRLHIEVGAKQLVYQPVTGTTGQDVTITVINHDDVQVINQAATQSFTTAFQYGDHIIFDNPQNAVLSLTNDVTGKAAQITFGAHTDLIIEQAGVETAFIPTATDHQGYLAELQRRLGQDNLAKLTQQDPAFMKWLEGNDEALNAYLTGGYASNQTENKMSAYHFNNQLNQNDEYQALQIWAQIWAKDANSHQGTNLKIAVAVSLEFTHGVIAWLQQTPIDPVARYELYANAYKQGILMPDFSEYSVREMRDIVNVRATDDDLTWLQNEIRTQYPYLDNRDYITKGYSLIKYTEHDIFGSVFHKGFYGPNPDISKVMEYGGVCGAISKFSSILARAFGVPAYAVGQPAHCCYVYEDPNHEWTLGYAIRSWDQTSGHDTFIPLMKTANAVDQDQNKMSAAFAKVFDAEALASTNPQQASQLVDQAIALEPMNIQAWQVKVQLANQMGATNGLADQINQTFVDFPSIATSLTSLINGNTAGTTTSPTTSTGSQTQPSGSTGQPYPGWHEPGTTYPGETPGGTSDTPVSGGTQTNPSETPSGTTSIPSDGTDQSAPGWHEPGTTYPGETPGGTSDTPVSGGGSQSNPGSVPSGTTNAPSGSVGQPYPGWHEPGTTYPGETPGGVSDTPVSGGGSQSNPENVPSETTGTSSGSTAQPYPDWPEPGTTYPGETPGGTSDTPVSGGGSQFNPGNVPSGTTGTPSGSTDQPYPGWYEPGTTYPGETPGGTSDTPVSGGTQSNPGTVPSGTNTPSGSTNQPYPGWYEPGTTYPGETPDGTSNTPISSGDQSNPGNVPSGTTGTPSGSVGQPYPGWYEPGTTFPDQPVSGNTDNSWNTPMNGWN